MMLASLLGAALALGGCVAATTDAGTVVRTDDQVSGTGTVRWYTIEGGFYAIRGDDGVTYDPINLAESWRHDGLRVRFQALIRNDLGSFHMAGPIVELRQIAQE